MAFVPKQSVPTIPHIPVMGIRVTAGPGRPGGGGGGPPPGGGGVGGGSHPAAPTSLTATAISDTEINLAWTDNQGSPAEDGFKIERKAGAGAFVQVGTAASNATSYADSGLTASTLYTYRVRAYRGTKNSGYSNEASDTTDSTHLLEDGFDGAASSLAAHTPDVGPGWTIAATGSTWNVTGSGTVQLAKDPGGTARDFAWMDSGEADVIISCQVKGNVSNIPGIIARLSDSGANCWLISVSPAGDVFTIVQREAGSNTTRATTSVTIDAGTFYTIVVTLSGNTITATLNGGNQIQYTSATFQNTATKHGIHEFNDTTGSAEFEEFLVVAN